MNQDAKEAVLSAELLAALSQLNEDAAREQLLRSQNLLHAKTVIELNAATQVEFRVNTVRALALAEAAILVSRSLGDDTLLAQSIRVKANVVAASGEYQSAIELYRRALTFFEGSGDDEGIARTLTAIIQPYIMQGEYDAAFESARRAEELLERLGDSRRLARLENNIGNIYHRQDRFTEALVHYERGYDRLLPYGDSEELTISLNNISMCLITMNDFPRAMATYKHAKQLLEDHDLPLIRLITDYNIAYLYYLRGDYRRAIEMLKSARVAGQKIGYTYLVALCYLDLSDIYVELNLSAEALDVAHEGNQLFRKLEIGYEAAKTLANEAIALGQSGKLYHAVELFVEARQLFVLEKNEVWPWLIDLYQAVAFFQQARHFEARKLALSAAQFFDNSSLRGKSVLCHLLLSQIAMHTGDAEGAASECSATLQRLQSVDSPILRFQGHFLSGQLDQSRGELRAAYRAYQAARTELESLRSALGRDELKISFMKNKTELYERLVELCMGGKLEGTSQQEAFGYIELAKSRSLTELIFQRSHAFHEAKPGQSEFAHKIRDLREELNWYQHRIEMEQLRPGETSEQQIEGLHSEAQAREKALLRMLGELREGELESAGIPSPDLMPLSRIQTAIRDGECLLEYFSAGDRILAAIVTNRRLEILPVTTISRISDALRLLRFQLGKIELRASPSKSELEDMRSATVAHLGYIYDELIRPLGSHIRAQHLIIVPHGILHALPFHALYDGNEYLIDRHTISYAPSATIYALCQEQSGAPGIGSLVLGVPDARAPHIAVEVESVHRTMPESQVFIGDDANHDLFNRLAPTKRLIHVATHGQFRPDNPIFSSFRLGDGAFYLYELNQMQLSADLLTLSGCSTGLNVIAAGDELLGLIRGALFAGARAVLLTLWDVNDKSTAEFMTAFYRRLAETGNKAQALADAARDLRERYPHPYFWAPFFLVGKS